MRWGILLCVASQTNCGQPVDYVKVPVKIDLEKILIKYPWEV
jgi:hypothetical protein